MTVLPRTRVLALVAAAAIIVPNVAGWSVMRVDPVTNDLVPTAPDLILRALAALSVIGMGVAMGCVWTILVRFVSRRMRAGEKYVAGNLRGPARRLADPGGAERVAMIGATGFVTATLVAAVVVAAMPSP